jgi:CubicO group peptidase (beta-lactamase class C family)
MPPVAHPGQLIRAAVDRRLFPAAVVDVGSSAGPIWQRAFGTLTFDARARSAELDTIFDLASLTKPIATASVILELVESQAVGLDDRIAPYFPEWLGNERACVTVRHLLEHSGGLAARLLDRPPDERRAFEHEICTMPLEYLPVTRSLYSDLGFILLGFLAESVGRAPFAALAGTLLESCLRSDSGRSEHACLLESVPREFRDRTAPTTPMAEDDRRGRHLVGEVHDNYAVALGGFAGHAGLFGTASGVASLARTMLRALSGAATAPSPFTPERTRQMVTKCSVPGSSRALGWDTMLPTSSCGTKMSEAAFGHVGFTGTSVWIDPVRDRYFVLLTNRVCDGGTTEQMQALRRAFHDACAAM